MKSGYMTSLRYKRQLPLIGEDGQEKLRSSLVAIVGLGGIGSPLALYLCGVGVNLRLIDGDRVSLDNLHRQILYGEDDIGLPKALVAERELRRRNSEISIEGIPERLNKENVGKLFSDVDLVLDATDNFNTRYVINEFCVRKGLPFIYSAISGYYFAVSFIMPGKTPCLKCIFPSMEDSGPVPVIGSVPALVASISATEAIKYLTKGKPSLMGELLVGDLNTMEVSEIRIKRNPKCPVCGTVNR